MSNYRILLFAAALLSLASCGKTTISGKLAVDSESEIVVRALELNAYNVLDTIKTDAAGNFKYQLKIEKGQPEFVYLFYGQKRIAGVLIEKGEKLVVEADTLGSYTVTGSEASEKLAEIDKAYTKFNNDLYAAREDAPAMAKIYLEHYRACVRHILSNPYSMTNIPVLYETLGDASPVFNQSTDAIFFKGAADSLATVYPESKYVKALAQEADRRMKYLQFETSLLQAEETSFPEINLPDINGERKKLSEVEAKVILIHYWDAANPEQKMMNIELLKPLYKDYKSKGFEIYSVCVSPDKALWGNVVKSQGLDWINVNDGLGAASPALACYNVQALPHSLLIIDGEIDTQKISGVDGLRKVLDKAFRR